MTCPENDPSDDDGHSDKSKNREAAIQYAERGWPVFPCHSIRADCCTCGKHNCPSPGKHPHTRNGCKDATTDIEQIKKWWQHWPDANVAIATGSMSGVVALDVDPKHGGENSLADLIAKHGELPLTTEQATGGGGIHFLFAHPGGVIGNRTGVRPGLDIRGDGGYIITAPSTHASGRQYKWKPECGPHEIRPAPLPDWLREVMLQRNPHSNGNSNGDVADTDLLLHRATQYVAKVGVAIEGERNNTAFNLAGNLAAFEVEGTSLRLSEQQIIELMQTWNDQCDPPLVDTELASAVHSAVTNGTPRPKKLIQRQESVSNINSTQRVTIDWSDPKPLPDELSAVAPFEYSFLPESVAPFVRDVAERMQCPPDYTAVTLIVVFAGLVGRKVGIRPKRHDDWLVVPNLWGLAIGRPGLMKTPAMDEVIKFLKRLEIAAKDRFDEAMKEYAIDEMVSKAARKNAESKIKKALKDDDDPHAIAAKIVDEEIDAPTRQRFVINDSTVEKLGEILNQNSNGVTLVRDEIYGFLQTLDREGRENDRGFYLESWNGTGRYTYDRIGRGTIDIEAAIISIIGSIQPGRLGEYVQSAIRGGKGDDGLIQRFQLAVWPDCPTSWRNVDRWPDSEAKSAVFNIVTRLDNLSPADVEVTADDEEGIPYLRFDHDAQERFDDWRSVLEHRVRGDELHPAMESHLAKFRSLIPSLALLIHLADDDQGNVTLVALDKAIRWGEYLESHAHRIYSMAVRHDIVTARRLAQKILKGSLKDGFSIKDVYRPGWSGLASAEEAREGVEFLIDLNWLHVEEQRTGGRTKYVHWVNPRVFDNASLIATAKTAESPSGGSGSASPGVCEKKNEARADAKTAESPSGSSGSASPSVYEKKNEARADAENTEVPLHPNDLLAEAAAQCVLEEREISEI